MTRTRFKSALVALFCFAATLIGANLASALETRPLTIEMAGGKSHVFTVELALTGDQRAQGLMHRQSMAPDHGMLFDFGQPRLVTMWMRDTPLSLDMLFVGTDGVITRIAPRTTPFSDAIISSGDPVKYVLEINGGRAEQLGISIGDRLVGEPIAASLK